MPFFLIKISVKINAKNNFYHMEMQRKKISVIFIFKNVIKKKKVPMS